MRFKKTNVKPQLNQPNNEIIHSNIDTELFINIDDINKEIMDQPLLFRKYARLEAEAAKVVRTLELQLERAKAQAYLEMKSSLIKATVKDIESKVALNEKVIKIENELIEAQLVHEEMKGALMAFRQRHDSLKDLAANMRKEYGD